MGNNKNNHKRRMAMISVHSDPSAKLGEHETGGQNVYVSELSKALGQMGWSVDIFTRLTRKRTKMVKSHAKNVNIIYIKAGPRYFIRKDKIISINAIIREDSTSSRQQFKIDQWGTAEPSGDIQVIENDGDNGFTVRLTRVTGEFFDGTRFNGTTDSRGYILIHYDNS